jgi:hypothetical protein
MRLISRQTPLPISMRDWLETFAQRFTATLPEADRATFLDEVTQACRCDLCDASGQWTADYVRLRFSAFKPTASSIIPARACTRYFHWPYTDTGCIVSLHGTPFFDT